MPGETLRLSILRGGTHKESRHSKTKGLSTHLRGQRIEGTKDSRDCLEQGDIPNSSSLGL
jgi:hypothetical protein